MDYGAIARRLSSRAARRKLVRAMPVVGTAIIALEARGRIREKGATRGAIDIALDLAPVIGTAKAIYEALYGDLIRPRAEAR